MAIFQRLMAACLVFLSSNCIADEVPIYHSEIISIFQTFDATQAVAVDSKYFYATHHFRITKHDKITGEAMLQWDGVNKGNVLIHFDSLIELAGKLYASHSNYGTSPMTSSVEIWDAETMEHIDTHSFGINRGSFTWLDRYQGFWWGAFANYDKVQQGSTEPYGETRNTKIVKMDDKFNILESWILPDQILDKMRPMSNSGGSWGPDGYLYLTGHDHGELYVMEIPKAGSILHWAATVKVPLMEGQGIAWDRSVKDRVLWSILKKERKVFKVRMPHIEISHPQPEGIIQRDHFNRK